MIGRRRLLFVVGSKSVSLPGLDLYFVERDAGEGFDEG